MLEYPLLLVFPVSMVFAAAFDLFTMTIPNRISILLGAGFLLVAPLSGLPVETIGMHVAAGALVLALGFFAFVRGWLGGGDAKLLAAASLWLGFESLDSFAIAVGLLGGLLSCTILAFRVYVPASLFSGPHWLVRLHGKDNGVPYGLAIGAAALWLYPQTRWFSALIS
jgi:prepilin peptidase CpaA